jgi:hypothetical protein
MTLTTKIETYHLKNGITVLAKAPDRPYTFANATQAQKHAVRLRAQGINASVHKNPMYRPFYVRIDA